MISKILPLFKAWILTARSNSAYVSNFSASVNLTLLGSTIKRASYVSMHALIQRDKLPAGSLTLKTFSF